LLSKHIKTQQHNPLLSGNLIVCKHSQITSAKERKWMLIL